eukprot:XP_011431689.1 PREDICTED: procyclic form-specific polypeptide B-alpha-like [Crassostrea gigas]
MPPLKDSPWGVAALLPPPWRQLLPSVHPSGAGTSHNNLSWGPLFTASNNAKSNNQMSYAQAAGPKSKQPMGTQQSPPPPTQHPPQPSRKRADPQSEPMATPNPTLQPHPSPPLEVEEEPEDTPFFIQLAQQAEEKKDTKSEEVSSLMKFFSFPS